MTLLCRKISSTLNTFVPVLDGTNYQQWAAAMQSYLMSQGQWRVIIRNPPIPKYADSVPVEQVLDKDGQLDIRRTQRAQEVTDRAAQLTGPTNQDAIDEWDEAISKAIGNIRLRLCHHAIFHAHFSTVFSTLSPTQSFIPFTFSLLSLFSTLLSRYRLAIQLMTFTNFYDLMTIPFIIFLFFLHTLSFDEMRT